MTLRDIPRETMCCGRSAELSNSRFERSIIHSGWAARSLRCSSSEWGFALQSNKARPRRTCTVAAPQSTGPHFRAPDQTLGRCCGLSSLRQLQVDHHRRCSNGAPRGYVIGHETWRRPRDRVTAPTRSASALRRVSRRDAPKSGNTPRKTRRGGRFSGPGVISRVPQRTWHEQARKILTISRHDNDRCDRPCHGEGVFRVRCVAGYRPVFLHNGPWRFANLIFQRLAKRRVSADSLSDN